MRQLKKKLGFGVHLLNKWIAVSSVNLQKEPSGDLTYLNLKSMLFRFNTLFILLLTFFQYISKVSPIASTEMFSVLINKTWHWVLVMDYPYVPLILITLLNHRNWDVIVDETLKGEEKCLFHSGNISWKKDGNLFSGHLLTSRVLWNLKFATTYFIGWIKWNSKTLSTFIFTENVSIFKAT